MENMKFVCSDKRPEGMEEDFTGSQGSLRTAAVEEEEEEKKKKKKKKEEEEEKKKKKEEEEKTMDIIEL